MMKALVFTDIGVLELRDVEKPSIGSDNVLVRVAATGICGSDVHGFLGHQKRRRPGLVLGHETVGVVEEGPSELIGKRVSVNPLVSCGECRACRSGFQNRCRTWRLLGMDSTPGAFAEYVAVPRRNVFPIPDSMSDAAAVMVEPLANAVHILSMIPSSAGLLPSVVILGGGTLGAAILAVAKVRGLNILAVTEPNPLRAQAVRDMGAPKVIDPLLENWVDVAMQLSGGEGVDAVVDAVGRSHLRTEAASAVCRGGTVLLLGMDEGPSTFDFQDLVRREVRLQCSYAYTERDFQEALGLVSSGVVSFERWTDALPLEQGQAAFDRLARDPGDRLKIVLVP